MPYIESNLHEIVTKIENLYIKLSGEWQEPLSENIINNYNAEIENCREEIIKKISVSLGINDIENAFIDYAINISRIMITGNKDLKHDIFSEINNKEIILSDYAQIFINRFSTGLSISNKKFIVEVWHTKQIIGMIFKVIPESEYTEDIVFINKQYNSDITPFLLKVSSEKITDKLFVQKDIRGFDSDDFYIFKPNEKRLWHKAVAYLDADEFADAMLKAGRRAK